MQVWDAVDIWTHFARRYKAISKRAYTLSLLLAVAITTIAVVSINRNDLITEYANRRRRLRTRIATYFAIRVNKAEGPEFVTGSPHVFRHRRQQRSHLVLYLSIAYSLVAAMTAYVDPTKRWVQLRGGPSLHAYSLPVHPIARAQVSSGVLVTMPFAWRGRTKSPATRASPRFTLWLE